MVPLDYFEPQSPSATFGSWEVGQDLFKALDAQSDLLDRDVRPLAEECDQLSGLQVFTSTDDGWGGFSASYLDMLRDEFGKNSIWVWGLEDGLRVSRVSKSFENDHLLRSEGARQLMVWLGEGHFSHHKCRQIAANDGTGNFCVLSALKSSFKPGWSNQNESFKRMVQVGVALRGSGNNDIAEPSARG